LATMGVASSARREGSRVGCGLFDRLNEWLPSTEDVRARGANDCANAVVSETFCLAKRGW